MPELPEVETIRRGLDARLSGVALGRVEVGPLRLRKVSERRLEGLAGKQVLRVTRHAKRLVWHLDDGVLETHLGMTGKWLFESPTAPVRPHTHVRVDLGGERLVYVDPRRFGWLSWQAQPSPTQGLDALDPAFTPEALAGLLAASRAPAKAFLMDQTQIAGLGNIYACEALWRAGISPRRRACDVRRPTELHAAIQGVLADALAVGGTTFNDYVDALGQKGGFLFQVGVFRREGEACPKCGRRIRRLVQAGRSTFCCLFCQR